MNFVEKYDRDAKPIYSNTKEHRDIWIARIKPQYKGSGIPSKIVIKTITMTADEENENRWIRAVEQFGQEKDKLAAFRECRSIISCFGYQRIVNNDTIEIAMAMEYARTDLKYQIIKLRKNKEQFSLEEIKKIIEDILLALDEIHRKNMIHCDIKPENIMFKAGSKQKALRAKLADFGAAKITVDENDQKIELIGEHLKEFTMSYVAPEMIVVDDNDGEGYIDADAILTSKYDIWGVGVILFTLIFGEKPFVSTLDDIDKAQGELLKNIKIGNFTVTNWKQKLLSCYENDDEFEKMISMLKKMLRYNPTKRHTASQLLNHRIFRNDKRDEVDKVSAQQQPSMKPIATIHEEKSQVLTNTCDADDDEKQLGPSQPIISTTSQKNENGDDASARDSRKPLGLREMIAMQARNDINRNNGFAPKFGQKKYGNGHCNFGSFDGKSRVGNGYRYHSRQTTSGSFITGNYN